MSEIVLSPLHALSLSRDNDSLREESEHWENEGGARCDASAVSVINIESHAADPRTPV